MTGLERITRARAALIIDRPWFGALALRLRVVEDMRTGGLSTDGTTLGFNPDKIASWSDAQVRAGIAHEVLHCALLHPYRAPASGDWELWKQATDYAINPLLAAQGFTLWDGALIDPAYDGMTAEQVYAALRQRQREQAEQNPPSPSQSADPGDAGAESRQNGTAGAPEDDPMGLEPAPSPGQHGPATAPGEPDPMGEDDWIIAAEQAAMVGRKAGHMPGDVDGAMQAARKRSADWRAILREFVEQAIPSDFSWASPARAFLPGLFVPGVVRENCPAIDVYVDTSGSTRAELPIYAAELTAILHEVRPAYMRVIYCDSEVQGEQRFDPDDPEVRLEHRGGGGTKFQPAFDYALTSGELPAVAVYFTDLEGPAPRDPGWPVLWVTTAASRREGPFGRTVRAAA